MNNDQILHERAVGGYLDVSTNAASKRQEGACKGMSQNEAKMMMMNGQMKMHLNEEVHSEDVIRSSF